MRQTLGFLAVWCGATVLATSIAWFGVSDVLRGQVFDDARIEPINAAISRMEAAPLPSEAPTGQAAALGTPTASASPEQRAPAPRRTQAGPTHNTARPRATRSPLEAPHITVRSPATAEPRPSASAAGPRPTLSAAAPGPSVPAASEGKVRVVNVGGGSVSFVIEDDRCRLVAAAPNVGFEAKVSQALGWIRVDLARNGHGTAVFCIGGENRTDTWDY
ncbi:MULTISPECIES: hypothetical protein [Streptosporangium]|uniref:Secreted protein n=1 Tax=Streptosporangium brasiliense TaxID=47480 RepID=A0ABT9RAA3_9ACTN|nr:hypothetical protein [Streptosporangium brasiliense]MDP9866191.1 hypothetical protein [Streptosporangium brasiliense]